MRRRFCPTLEAGAALAAKTVGMYNKAPERRRAYCDRLASPTESRERVGATLMNEKVPLTIAFGRGHLSLSLPREAAPTVVRKRSLPKLKDAAAAIAQALDAPIGSAPLGQ